MERQHYTGTKAAVCSTQGKLNGIISSSSTKQAQDFQEKKEHKHLQSWTISCSAWETTESCLQQHHFIYKTLSQRVIQSFPYTMSDARTQVLRVSHEGKWRAFLALKASHPQHLFEGNKQNIPNFTLRTSITSILNPSSSPLAHLNLQFSGAGLERNICLPNEISHFPLYFKNIYSMEYQVPKSPSLTPYVLLKIS